VTSGGRELLKWLALVLMTGDHAIKVFALGYVPVVTELGRVAFPIFALVMAYNLSRPGADLAKSIRRLSSWAVVATPAAWWAFGFLLPLNVLATFAVGAGAIYALQARQWPLAAFLLIAAPFAVDYQWAGVWLVVAAWHWFSMGNMPMACLLGRAEIWRGRLFITLPVWIWSTMALLCLYNGNVWALLALPLMLLAKLSWTIPRTKWGFYGYYVAHLALFAGAAAAIGA